MTALDEDQRKHLDFIQGVIARMSTDSFLIKGWALTVAAAIYGFAANRSDWRIALVGLLPAIMFWGLDAYYLWQERLFRKLYAEAAAGAVDAYSMDVESYEQETKWRGTLVSRTIWPVYVLIVVVGAALIVDGATRHPSNPVHSGSKAAAIVVMVTS
jgi:hypothetical protein